MAGRHEEDLVEVGEADTHTVADSGSSTTVSKPPVRAAVPPTTKPPRTGIMGLYDKVFDWCWNNRVGTLSWLALRRSRSRCYALGHELVACESMSSAS